MRLTPFFARSTLKIGTISKQQKNKGEGMAAAGKRSKRFRRRAGLVVLALVAAAMAPSGSARVAAAPPAGAGAIAEPTPDEKEVARLRDFLVAPDRTFGTRRDAATALLEKGSDAANAVLIEVLATPSEAAMAVLDVLAAHDSGAEAFIDPLFNLLKSDDETIRRRASLAFGVYQGNDKVLEGLKKQLADTAASPPVRLAALEALAQIVDRRAIEALVEATADADKTIAGAAALALGDMTGLVGVPPAGWKAWWESHKREPEAMFLRGLLRRFRADLRRRDTALATAQVRLARLMDEAYEVADTKEKGRMILLHLEDPLPLVRAVAARQATVFAREVLTGPPNGGRQAYQDLISSLMKHVIDESPDVRAASAEALGAWQEPAAGPVLMARLGTEKTSDVRAALAGALGTLKVAEAVPELIKMLASPAQAEVVRAAGAIGSIGERSGGGSAAIEPAVEPLSRLARTSDAPAVREAACRALARIAHPTAEPVLVAALEDQAPGVRFSAAQGLAGLGRAKPETVLALIARIQDDNKGVRQAVAAALGKLAGADAARKLADRLKQGGEADPAVQNAFWAAVLALVEKSEGPALAEELAGRFFALGGTEQMQRAAALLESARVKYPAAAVDGAKYRALLDRLVDAWIAAGTPRRAVPALRQLLESTPAEDTAGAAELKQQLGLILLPDVDGATLLAEAMEATDAESRPPLVRAILDGADALLRGDEPGRALDLLDAFKKARPDWGGTDLGPAAEQLYGRATDATIARAIVQLNGSDAAQAAAAAARLKTFGKRGARAMLAALEAAARESRTEAETKLLAGLETVTGRKNHGYDLKAPLEQRVAAIAAWRQLL